MTVPLAWRSRKIPFAHAERTAVTIPWGDVFTAFISTGVPDIEVYISMPPATIAWLRRLRWMQSFLGRGAGGAEESHRDAASRTLREGSRNEFWRALG